MDSITQAALGAVVGEAVLGRRLGWRGAVWGAFFGTLPDLDILVSPFLDEAARLRWHRGISHSILVMFAAAFLFCKPLAHLHRERGLTWRRAWVFVFLAWSTHVLIDCFTTYGTQIWEPFSDARVSFNNLFIIDLFFTVPMLLSLCFIFRFDPLSKVRRRINAAAISLSCLYVVLSFAMKSWAQGKLAESISLDLPQSELIAVSPTVSNVFLWRALAETEDAYHVRYWSPFDESVGELNHFPKHHELAEKMTGEPVFEALKWFSRGYWVARQAPNNEEGEVIIIDMRYGAVRDLESRSLRPVFHWKLNYDAEGQLQMEGMRPQMDAKKTLQLLWERLKGKTDRWEGLREF